MLTEVFPEACSLEIQNCLMVANGDVESAVQLMLVKKENIDEEWKENVHQTVDHVSPKVTFLFVGFSNLILQVTNESALNKNMNILYALQWKWLPKKVVYSFDSL